MIKNLIIVFLIYIVGSLLITKPDNIEILKNLLLTTKEFITSNYNYYIENNSQITDFNERIPVSSITMTES